MTVSGEGVAATLLSLEETCTVLHVKSDDTIGQLRCLASQRREDKGSCILAIGSPPGMLLRIAELQVQVV